MKKIVVKIGTKLLTSPDRSLDIHNLKGIVDQISSLHSRFHVILVSSGSVTSGSKVMDIIPETIPEKQAAAAVGQILLMQKYAHAFGKNQIQVGQILLSKEGIADPTRQKNISNTIQKLLAHRVIPIVNENDSVATDEIRFGDNDELSSHVARLVQASCLLLLTDIDGLYKTLPTSSSKGQIISTVTGVTNSLLSLAKGPQNNWSRGGMKSKLLAAKYATEHGIKTVIANGRRKNVIVDCIEGKPVGTTLNPI